MSALGGSQHYTSAQSLQGFPGWGELVRTCVNHGRKCLFQHITRTRDLSGLPGDTGSQSSTSNCEAAAAEDSSTLRARAFASDVCEGAASVGVAPLVIYSAPTFLSALSNASPASVAPGLGSSHTLEHPHTDQVLKR